MSSSGAAAYLEDILASSRNIQSFLAGIDFETYQADRKTSSTVERQLQILTEAAYRLGNDAETLRPSVDWRAVRGLGNVLRHEYDGIDNQIVWEAVHTRLPALETAVRSALTTLQTEPNKPA